MPLLILFVLFPDLQEPITFQIIRISSFYSRFLTQNLGSAWLDELQTHAWENNSDTVIYLHPWSKGNFSDEELIEVEKILHTFFIRLGQALYNHASQWKLECKFSSLNGCWGYGASYGVCMCVYLSEFLISLISSLLQF